MIFVLHVVLYGSLFFSYYSLKMSCNVITKRLAAVPRDQGGEETAVGMHLLPTMNHSRCVEDCNGSRGVMISVIISLSTQIHAPIFMPFSCH